MPRWSLAFATLVLALVSLAIAAPPVISDEDVLLYLDQTIGWYRSIIGMDQPAIGSRQALFDEAMRQNANKTLHLAFDFARAVVTNLGTAEKPATPTASGAPPGRNLAQTAATVQQQITQLQTQIDDLNAKIPKTNRRQRPGLIAQRDKLLAESNLAKARLNLLQSVVGYMSGPEGSGLLAQIQNLERSVPEIQNKAPDATGRAAAQEVFRPESAGIVALTSQMFALSQKMRRLSDLAAQTAAQRDGGQKLLIQLRNALEDTIKQGNTIAQTSGSPTPEELNAQRRQLDALATWFKQLSAVVTPLRQQLALLDSTRGILLEWRTFAGQEYRTVLRYLLLRLAVLGIGILLIFFISEVWRRATVRYVQDIRRRRQILLVRRIVITFVVVIFLILSFVTQFGSFATFAGFFAAGIAVALQSVILSIVAYFFFIGRWGVRVGDRVTLSGVTGDVIDLGLFRMYLMELGGTYPDLQPTGRLVVFPNATLFQPSALFKQFPGIGYTWHDVALTLAPESDYLLAERRLMAAVESVYAEYRETVERQYATVRFSLNVPVGPPRPEGRLRFVESGIEFVIRYPVEIRRAAEIDDRITRKLVEAIAKEPKLKLVASSTPRIQAAA